MRIKLDEGGQMPVRGSQHAAGYDIYSVGDYEIAPGSCVKVKTGLHTELPPNTFAAVFPRSGLATKNGLRLSNCVAVIDEDYRGEWLIPLYNDSDETQIVPDKTRIAQFVIIPYLAPELIEADDLDETTRGDGGFGSTGTK